MKTIKNVIEKFDKEFIHQTIGGIYSWKAASLTRGTDVRNFLQSSLTSLLDSLEKETLGLGCYTQTTLSSGKKVNLVSKEEVIDIINSHR